MMKWLMYGVLVFCAMNFAQAMHHLNLAKADNKHIEKY